MKPVLIVPNTNGKMLSLNNNYIEKLNNFNVKSVIAHYDKSFIDNIFDFSGVLLTGGGDISEKYLKEKLHPKAKDIFVCRDDFEIDIVKKAYLKKIPTLGICRGMQIMNVALGGEINQHIEGHIQQIERNLEYHYVKIDKNSKLYQIFNKDKIKVNSFHHQVVKALGKNIVASAFSQDNYIEAIETTEDFFFLGVQWHPEVLDGIHNYIFKHFVRFILNKWQKIIAFF